MNVLELRNRIIEILDGYIGNYVLDDGDTKQAVWTGGRVSNVVTDVSGLEIVISATPDLDSDPIMGGDKIVRRVHKVRLIQHASNTPMDDELMLLIAHLPIERGPIVQDETDDRPQQATLYIRDDMIVYGDRVS